MNEQQRAALIAELQRLLYEASAASRKYTDSPNKGKTQSEERNDWYEVGHLRGVVSAYGHCIHLLQSDEYK